MRSLDAPVHDEENDSASAGDLIGADDEEFDRVEAGVTLERLTGILDERAREILRLRFSEDLLQSEIAERRRLLADARLAHHPLLAGEALRLRIGDEGGRMSASSKSRSPPSPPTPIAPPEPATPAVPEEPIVPADPTPDRETPPPPTTRPPAAARRDAA